MNIYKVNLNLLKVFVVVMREQHISEAAKSLQLSQPAISHSLQQLRELFQDELLIRGPQKMIPTQKALLLAPQIEQILTQLETLLFFDDIFEFQTSQRTFYLGMSDYAEYVILPKLYEKLKKRAPNISLQVLTYQEFTSADFEQKKIELGLGLEKKIPKQLMSERLFNDHSICVAHKNHAIFKQPFTLEHYLQAEHLVTCIYSEGLSYVDQALKKLNVARKVKLTLQNFLPAFQAIAHTNLIGTFSHNLAKKFIDHYPLQTISPPFVIPEYHFAQIWHRQDSNDSGLIWLRGLIKEVCQEAFSHPN